MSAVGAARREDMRGLIDTALNGVFTTGYFAATDGLNDFLI